jgi:general transcription factor 3C polypeptide 5 (transcription factor C subunit 1)
MRADPNSEILPPPLFSNTVIPHTYNFRQNPAVKRALIDGKTKLLNFQAAPKTLTPMVHISIADIPEKPTNIPSYESLDSLHKECVDNLRALFDQRPIWTRRALYNNFPKHLQTLVRFAMAHVAYMWRAGPWRDTCVLYGLDPRNDSKYRIYQSVFFQIETNKSRPSYPTHHNINEASHIFDGKRLIRDGRCFQLCDVTDPLLVQIINTKSLRKSCDPTDGWYRHSTLTKIKSIMKAKIQGIAIGKPLTDADCLPILEQESEDEEQEAERKRKDERDREMRAEKRRKAVRYFRHPGENTAVEESVAGEEAQEGEAREAAGEDGEEEDADGEWDEELELPQTQGEVDGKVKEMMAMLGRGDIGMGQAQVYERIETDFRQDLMTILMTRRTSMCLEGTKMTTITRLVPKSLMCFKGMNRGIMTARRLLYPKIDSTDELRLEMSHLLSKLMIIRVRICA